MQMTTVVSESENRPRAHELISDDFTAAAIGLAMLVLIIVPAWWIAATHGMLYAVLSSFCMCGLLCSGGVICACVAGKRSES